MKATQAVVQNVRAELEQGRLVVRLCLYPGQTPGGTAYLPDRELSALLPRSLLVGPLRAAPPELLSTIRPILERLMQGRTVRLWDYRERRYASFLSWRAVRVAPPTDPGEPSRPNEPGDSRRPSGQESGPAG